MSNNDDDKPTVVLDLNALKKQKLKQEEELANIESELEFNVGQSAGPAASVEFAVTEDAEAFAEQFLDGRARTLEEKKAVNVILFDFQSDFFQQTISQFPKGFKYHIAKNLTELNKHLAQKTFQIVVFNYDVSPKAVNQLTSQIKQKFPQSKTVIMAMAISPQKAKLHAQTPSGAHGYYQYPLVSEKIEREFQKIIKLVQKKKVS